MIRYIFFSSVVLCLLLTGLSQIPNPENFGIQGESERILYYGGIGLLAGACGLIALGSGIYLGVARFCKTSVGLGKLIPGIILLVFLMLLAMLALRFGLA